MATQINLEIGKLYRAKAWNVLGGRRWADIWYEQPPVDGIPTFRVGWVPAGRLVMVLEINPISPHLKGLVAVLYGQRTGFMEPEQLDGIEHKENE